MQSIEKFVTALRDRVWELINDTDVLNMWIQLTIPKIEDAQVRDSRV